MIDACSLRVLHTIIAQRAANHIHRDDFEHVAIPNSVAMASSPTATSRRTPAASIIQRRRPSLPPSPTIVADEVEHATTRFYAGLDDLYTISGIPETVDWARETCSSLVAVHATFLFIEAYSLSKLVMPWRYLFDTRAIHALRLPSQAVMIPDLFALLTPQFWKPTLLWSATNLFVPLTFAYFYNLTVHTVKRNNVRVRVVRYNYDPLVFNVVKCMIVSAVYGAGFLSGYVDDDIAIAIGESQYSGFTGMMLGCFVCGLCSVWEATQRR